MHMPSVQAPSSAVTCCISAAKDKRSFVSSYRRDAARLAAAEAVLHEFLHAFENQSNRCAPV